MPKPFRRAVAVLVTSAAMVIAGLTSCGPSVAAVYEGKIRFEHCYRLDLDTNIAPTHREACWREWTSRYTYGQTRDRLEYARRRIAALSSGDARRPQLDLHREVDAAVTASAATEAPVPTNLHAPPPPTATPAPPPDAGTTTVDASAAARPEAGASPPGAECTKACQTIWQTCQARCDPGAGRKSTCGACKADYTRCVQRCLK